MKHYRPTTAPRRSRDRPKTAEAGAEAIRQAAIKLFATTNGEAVDWTLMAESLFRVAFHCLDKSPDADRRASILRRAETGVYDRIAGNIPAAAARPGPADTNHGQPDQAPAYDPPGIQQ